MYGLYEVQTNKYVLGDHPAFLHLKSTAFQSLLHHVQNHSQQKREDHASLFKNYAANCLSIR